MMLEDLPVELLSEILNDDASYLVIELWKCGSIVLNSKLRRGVVSITLTNPYTRSKTRYPRCLKEFVNLQTLAITSLYQELCTPESLRHELKQLTSKLTTLEVRVEGATTAFFGLNPDDASAAIDGAPSPSKRSKRIETDDADIEHAEAWNMDLTWPQLRHLMIECQHSPLVLLHCRLLPRNLEYLEVRHIYLNSSDYDQLRWLPTTLRTLKLRPHLLGPEHLSLLPPTITDIGESLNAQATVELARNPLLLPNIAEFPTNAEDGYLLAELAEEVELRLHQWPKNIKQLSFYSSSGLLEHGDGFIDLPPQLERLTAQQSYVTADVIAKHIPRSVTFMDFFRLEFDQIALSMWPPHMKTLAVANEDFGPHLTLYLPRTLTHFVLNDGRLVTFDDLIEGPTPHSSGSTPLHGVDKDLWVLIKSNLRDSDFATGDANDYISAVESGRLYGFPLTLTEMDLTAYQQHRGISLLLPPQLRKLTLMPTASFQANEFFRLLPPSLVELRLLCTTHGDDLKACAVSWDLQSVDPSTTWLFKSKNLTHLNIVSRYHDMSNLIKYLPRKLRHLALRLDDSCWSIQAIRDLPPSLTFFYLHCRRIGKQPPWVCNLPRSLTHLDASIPMAATEIAHLPPNLKTLRTRFHGPVTLDDILTVPKMLLNFSLQVPGDDESGLTWKGLYALIQEHEPFYKILTASRP